MTSSLGYSQSKDSLHDDAVAISILSKIAHLIQPQKMEDLDPRTIALLHSDFKHFTDTQRGQILKKQGEELAKMLVTGNLTPTDSINRFTPADEIIKFLRNKVKAYAKLSNAPTWIYKLYEIKPTKMQNH